MAKALYIKPGSIDMDKPFIDMGLDSIVGVEWINGLNKQYGLSIAATKVYDYSSLVEFSRFFEKELKLRKKIPMALRKELKRAISTTLQTPQESLVVSDLTSFKKRRFPKPEASSSVLDRDRTSSLLNSQEPIAIVGMAGKYPGAKDLEEYWKNLVGGKNSIQEVPLSRWDVNQYYDPAPSKPGKVNCKWLGLLDDIDCFDPLFFMISPAEAEEMDPQHRIFLEEGHKAFESAGYSSSGLSNKKCGVYLGIMSNEYSLLAIEAQRSMSGTSNNYAIGAARMAYYLNLKGPAIPIDTACSSSLVGTHLACQALHAGEIDMALVGGVTLYLTAESYIDMCASGMLSAEGQCKTFDDSADGFVPGEGVGAIVLKRLSEAQRNDDCILGTIIGSGINQDGKTNGITAPSVKSQIELEREIYRKYKIDPSSISYVETHGTGTKLGDPIELEALSTVFKEQTDRKNYCALGSVKSNIGHTSAAAGVASMHKALLSLKHQKLVPTLNFKKPNSHFNFDESPFYVNTELKRWESEGEKPRRVGVSSFGFSGTNAHVVIEEYVQKSEVRGQRSEKPDQPALIVLSAKNKDRLRAYAQNLIDYVHPSTLDFSATADQPVAKDLQPLTPPRLQDVAYTLQVGREAMEERLGLIVGSKDELNEKLQAFIEGKEDVEGLYLGHVKRNKDGLAVYAADEDMEKMVKAWIAKGKYSKLLDLWVKGLMLDWNKLYGEKKPHRISVPTYPFARERFWIEGNTEGGRSKTEGVARLHPLVHENTSTLEGQRFSSTFTGEEFFLQDDQVNRRKVLPGMAYLEMAREGIEQATGELSEDKNDNQKIELKNVVWARPINLGDQPQEVHIGLYPEGNGEIAYEIYTTHLSDGKPATNSKDEIVVHSQGTALFASADQRPKLDLKALQESCNQRCLGAEECYAAFKRMGLEYRSAHQGIENIYIGENEALAKLTLPFSILETKDQFILHPVLLDSALQASIGLVFPNREPRTLNPEPLFPFALESLENIDECSEKMWAWVRCSEDRVASDKVQKLDIDLCDEQGPVCVKVRGLSFRVLEGEILEKAETMDTLTLKPVWREKAIDPKQNVPEYADHQICLYGLTQTIESVENSFSGQTFIELKSDKKRLEERFEEVALDLFERIQKIVEDKPKGLVLLQVLVPVQGIEQTFSGLSGLLKTAHLENPKILFQVIAVGEEEQAEAILARVQENAKCPEDKQIRYEDGKRLVLFLEEMAGFESERERLWQEGGVYLITGGAGGLGLIFAKEIAERTKSARLILTGRSDLSEPIKEKVKGLESLGAHVEYHAVDVSDEQAVKRLIEKVQNDFGGINGILHSAGLIRDNFILKKTQEEFEETLKPKVDGVIHLDQATQHLPLDFFVLFSSVAGAIGNVGQADYATANAFMDTFARYRNSRMDSERSGQTLSMNWPLWKEGGMGVDEATEQMMREKTGMAAMQTAAGIEAFYQGLSSGASQVMVMEGNVEKIRHLFLADQPVAFFEKPSAVEIDPAILGEKTLYAFKKLFGEMIKLSVSKINPEEPFESYGVDSILITQLNQKLAGVFDEISKTLFFEYGTLGSLSDYFVKEYPGACARWTGVQNQAFDEPARPVPESVSPRAFPSLTSFQFSPERFGGRTRVMSAKRTHDPIAIIGLSGRYPQAYNVEEYWNHLKTGKDCITEIPRDRWSLEGFFHEDFEEAVAQGKSYSKWGGFLEGFSEFDPLFFNISSHEAMSMDPQERLFLQTCWEVCEDGGYTREKIAIQHHGKVGVFAGITKTGFDLYGPELWKKGEPVFPHTSFSSVANRVSYLLNLKGPSMPIDTMCSSSLTAIHEACKHVDQGECELAIAGGVNLYLHPSTYRGLCAQRMLALDRQCRSFGKGGNGFVPGEGVGAVLLKRLSQALFDGDHIYGVIRGTSANHGGKTNGYTVSNPKVQAELIRETLDKTGIDARTVSYIEAHGTATELGDPIEVAGLSQAFQQDTVDTGFCALGSAKSNVGHLEAAAGMAGVTKILLQMKHKVLVPSLHAKELNPNINFSKTPFVVQQELGEWRSPFLERDGAGKEYPRIAGISSFGAGGANAHVIIEEYNGQRSGAREQKSERLDQPALIVLSAKNEDRLKAYAGKICEYVRSNIQDQESNIQDLAYTLQIGREAMEERLGLIVHSMKELEQKLQGFIEGREDVEDLYLGQVKRNKETLAVFMADEELQEAMDKWVQRGKFSKLLDLWVKGLIFDWNKLYRENKPHRISLPTYPFARERYWVEGKDQTAERNGSAKRNGTNGTNGTTRKQDPEFSISTDTSSRWEFSLPKDAKEEMSHDSNFGTEEKATLFVQQLVADQLGKPIHKIDTQTGLFDMGLTSHHLLKVTQEIKNKIHNDFSPTSFFEYPTLSDLTSHLVNTYSSAVNRLQITKKKYQIRETNVKEIDADSSGKTLSIIRNQADRYKPFPLTDIQESFLSGRKLGSGGGVGCHVYFEIEFSGIDIYRLKKVWNRLIEYHEMLRAVISSNGQQKILKDTLPYEFKVIDLRRKSNSDQCKYLEKLRTKMSHKVYQPDQWPFFGIRISMCSDKQILHFSIDTMIADGFSLQMLFQQWQRAYQDPEWELPKINISFRDYTLAVKKFEDSTYYKKDLDYWVKKLENMPSGPLFPLKTRLDRPINDEKYTGIRLEGTLVKEEWQVLKKCGERLNVSPTVLLLNTFTEVLRVYCGQETFSVILTFFNRLLDPQLDRVLGPFISTNIFVAEEKEDRRFQETIQHNQKILFENLSHNYASGIRVLRELKKRRKISKTLSLPVVFTSLLGHEEKDDVGKRFLEKVSFSAAQTPQVYLDHQVREDKGALKFNWDVARGYYEPGLMDQIFSNYCRVLRMLATDFDRWKMEQWSSIVKKPPFLRRASLNEENGATSHKVPIDLLNKKAVEKDLQFKLFPDERFNTFPLTDQQQAYAFGRTKYGSKISIQLYMSFEVEGLDIIRLETAWRKVMEAHEMLTTVIHANGTQQVLENVPEFRIKTTDLRGRTAEAVEDELRRVESSMMAKQCPLGEWPYFDLQVSLINEAESRIHFSTDLIIADGTSIYLVLKELFYFYENPAELSPKNKITFRDYILSLQNYQKTEGYRGSLQYWKNKFSDIPPGPELPMYEEGGIHKTERLEGTLGHWNVLKEKAAELSISPSIILLTVYAEVLAAWSDSESFTIVVPSWERLPLHADINQVVGDFTAMSWLVIKREEKSFEEKLRSHHESVQEDLSHRAVSGLKALRMVGTKNRHKKMLTFLIVFTNLDSSPTFEFPKGFTSGKSLSQTPQVHVDNISLEENRHLSLHWDVIKGLFPEGMMQELFAGYQRVLECLANDPQSWQRTNFDSLINAQPENYQAVVSRQSAKNSNGDKWYE